MAALTERQARPRSLLALWAMLLSGPVAWAMALGVLFSLTDETCVSGSYRPMWLAAAACLALAVAPGAWAWRRRRAFDPSTPSAERARFMLDVAIGCSMLFTLVTALSIAPLGLLDPCRT